MVDCVICGKKDLTKLEWLRFCCQWLYEQRYVSVRGQSPCCGTFGRPLLALDRDDLTSNNEKPEVADSNIWQMITIALAIVVIPVYAAGSSSLSIHLCNNLTNFVFFSFTCCCASCDNWILTWMLWKRAEMESLFLGVPLVVPFFQYRCDSLNRTSECDVHLSCLEARC